MKPRMGNGVIGSKNVEFGKNTTMWNYGVRGTKDVPPREIVIGVPAKIVITVEECEGKRARFIRMRERWSHEDLV